MDTELGKLPLWLQAHLHRRNGTANLPECPRQEYGHLPKSVSAEIGRIVTGSCQSCSPHISPAKINA
ncbi:MAG: hypothetical protein B7Z55_13755 [Planctomycetales bacterium 12-60-4]|nr:MAG: hypothetical protein B7Z55_13755 [Planctomycetales bacterium 12-60-4]